MKEKIMEKLELELARLGLDYETAGPIDSVCVDKVGDYVRFYDDYEEVLLPINQAIEKLEKIESSEDFWTVIGEEKTLRPKVTIIPTKTDSELFLYINGNTGTL